MNKSIFGFGGARLLLAMAAFGMVFQLTGCTSSGEQNDVEAVQDVEGLDTAATPEGGGDDALLSDSLPEDALGSDVAAAPSALDDATTDSLTVTDPPSMVADDSSTTTDTSMGTTQDESLNEISSTETPVEEPVAEPAPKKANIPLQKVATAPWKSGGRWINAVYFARPGETLSSISQTIYGEDHSEELQKVNPTYLSRDPRPGDKVYYSSPKRPDDGTQVLTWHEENGQTPQIYVAKPGDNIRSVSKDLLGFDGAWKEVWSSNAAVESKGGLEEGTELRYWASAAAAPTEQVASGNMENNLPPPPAEPMPEAPPMEMPPMPDMMADNPPPMDDMNSLPPPPEPSQAMNELPPPPPPMEMAPPPPPPPVADHNAVAQESGAMDEDTMMALGTVAVAAAGIAGLLVVRRRRKQKELENQFGDSTHVGT
ncbi:MAG: hypothetical protein KF789_09355 [Bdellovibrionaceae bacterium]|nr:hypothetical protein [Pseudobdellovibrionaceae bacterium]